MDHTWIFPRFTKLMICIGRIRLVAVKGAFKPILDYFRVNTYWKCG